MARWSQFRENECVSVEESLREIEKEGHWLCQVRGREDISGVDTGLGAAIPALALELGISIYSETTIGLHCPANCAAHGLPLGRGYSGLEAWDLGDRDWHQDWIDTLAWFGDWGSSLLKKLILWLMIFSRCQVIMFMHNCGWFVADKRSNFSYWEMSFHVYVWHQ